MQQDKDALLRKLMEAEEDGTAAAKQVSALRESVSKLCGAGGSVSINLLHTLISTQYLSLLCTLSGPTCSVESNRLL